jgi:hypothetical protein
MNMFRTSLLTLDDFMVGGDEDTRLLYMMELFNEFKTEETYYALEIGYKDYRVYSHASHAIDKIVFDTLLPYRRGEKKVW